jgi:hypothetical protein
MLCLELLTELNSCNLALSHILYKSINSYEYILLQIQ